MRVQVVLHKDDLFSLRVQPTHSLHEAAVISLRSLLARLDNASARQWLKGYEQRASAAALVFIIFALWLSGFHWQRHDYFAQQLHGEFIKADNWALFSKGLVVEVQDVFHPRQVFARYLPDAP